MKIFSLFIIFLSLSVCVSCTKTIYEPIEVEKVRTEYVDRNSYVHDSIYIQDSVYVERSQDTMYIYKTKYITKERLQKDTMYLEKTDSIPYVVTTYVEKQLSAWQSFKLKYLSWITLILLAASITLYKKFK
jgi:hypothetical protein